MSEQHIEELQTQIDKLNADLDELRQAGPKKWKIPDGDYYTQGDGRVITNQFGSHNYRKAGVTRATIEQAELSAERRKPADIAEAFLYDRAPDYVPNWDNPAEEKYTPKFSTKFRQYRMSLWWTGFILGAVVMPKEVCKEFCDLANAGLIEGIDKP